MSGYGEMPVSGAVSVEVHCRYVRAVDGWVQVYVTPDNNKQL